MVYGTPTLTLPPPVHAAEEGGEESEEGRGGVRYLVLPEVECSREAMHIVGMLGLDDGANLRARACV